MSTFNRLVTKALTERNIGAVLRFPKVLLTYNEKNWVKFCADYLSKYSTLPTVSRLQTEFDLFIATSVEDPLMDLYDQVLAAKKKEYTIRYLMENEEALRDGKDPTRTIAQLYGALISASQDVELYSTFDREEYFENPIAMPFFIPELDNMTGGVGKTDVVWLSGRPGTHKTTYLKWMATNWVIRNKRVLFISNENAASTIFASIDAAISGWNPIKTRLGGWTESDKRRVKAAAYVATLGGGEVIVPKKGRAVLSDIIALAEEYQPDALLVDGVYLVRPTESFRGARWERETEVSQGLKAFALERNCPVIGTIQQGRKDEGAKATRDGVAGTDSYLRDADIFFATYYLDKYKLMEIIKNRWGFEGTVLNIEIQFERMKVSVKKAKFVEEEEDDD